MQKSYRNIGEYIEAFSEQEPETLGELNRETHLKSTHPQMLSGHLQGRFLSLLTHGLQPKNILEIGTFTGYSARCFLEGLPDDGQLISIDHNDELAYFHEKYLKNHPKSHQVEIIIGDALEEIPKLDLAFDMVFLDADKEHYPQYYDLLLPLLKPNGLLLADNVLWYEKVLQPAGKDDEATRSIQEFNEKVQQDSRVQVVILPLRDGLSIIRKK